jgi:hypothetical protein
MNKKIDKILEDYITEFKFFIKEGAMISKIESQIKKLEDEFDRLDSQGQSTLHITKQLEKLRKELIKWVKLNKAGEGL